MLGFAVLALVIVGLVVLPIALGVQRARWRTAQEQRVERLARTVGELREQLGLLSRRMALMEEGEPAAAGEKETPPVGAPPAPEPAPAEQRQLHFPGH